MLQHALDTNDAILYLRPTAALEESDFAQLAATVDPYIEEHGHLAGIVVEAPAFPGWESIGAMAAHFRFVRDHHRLVKKIALVTDSVLGDVAEHLASHFVAAEIRQFPAKQGDAARPWVLGRS